MRQWIQRHRKALIWVLLVLSLTLRIDHRYYYRNFYLDTEVQVAGAVQRMQGHGFSLPKVDPNNPTQTVYEPITVFMSGYGWGTQGSLWLFADPYVAVFALDVLALCLLYLALWGTLRTLTGRSDSRAALWIYLFLALSPAPLHYLTSSGLWCLAWGALALWRLLQMERSFWREMGLATICMVLAAWSRSAYVPLALLPLGIGLFLSLRSRNWQRVRLIGFAIVGVGIGVAAMVLSSPLLSSYHADTPKGLYWSHLQFVEPFAFKTFVYYGNPREWFLQGVNPFLLLLLHIFSHGLSLLLVFFLGKKVWQYGRIRKSSPDQVLGLWIFGTMILVVGLLAYQSLTLAPETWNLAGFWVFLMEPRYYTPIMWGIMMGTAVWAFENRKADALTKGIRLLLLGFLLLAYTYPLWLKVKVHVLGDVAGTFIADPLPKQLRRLSQTDTSCVYRWVREGESQASAMWGIPAVTPEEAQTWRNADESICTFGMTRRSNKATRRYQQE